MRKPIYIYHSQSKDCKNNASTNCLLFIKVLDGNEWKDGYDDCGGGGGGGSGGDDDDDDREKAKQYKKHTIENPCSCVSKAMFHWLGLFLVHLVM